MGNGLDDLEIGIRFPAGGKPFLSPRCQDWLLGPTHRPSQCVSVALSVGCGSSVKLVTSQVHC